MTRIKGLTTAEAERSLELHGDNSLKKEKSKGFFKRFIENLSDPIIRILIIALGVQILFSFGNCNFIEIGGIIAAILLSTTVSTASEYRSERAFEKLEADASSTEVSVLRNDSIVHICATDIVVGDVVYLFCGEKIQADGRIISGKISVDQSALNGESIECIKTSGNDSGWDLTSKSRVFRGSLITDGNAIMKVERVGGETYYGMVAKDVQTETRESPLKLRLSKLAEQISRIGYVVAAFVGITFLFNSFVLDNNFEAERIIASISDLKNLFSVLLRALTLMITVVVVAAPEGLPMMITVVLSANMKRMLQDSILVKKLVGIETAGSMNILFTDKTGTITYGRPQCEKIVTVGESYKSLSALKRSKKIFDLLNLSAKYNTDVICEGGELTGGNATDRAIFEFFMGEAADEMQIAEKTPFNSERKISSVRFKNGFSLIKGAAELILSASEYAISENGERILFDSRRVLRELSDAATKGERVIAVATAEGRDFEKLTFIALIVMKDKIRDGVSDAVRAVTRAGIQTVMITGDGRETASSIARECGILNDRAHHIVVTSDELRKMTDSEVKEILPRIRVVARALPQDKTRLVRLAGELDLVVGMTGDGINDAPSLKLADVGFAMGSGTDIAKSASDIVILDNSFTAISKTVLYGRTIFKSIRKFITFQLIMNLAACGVSLIGQFIGIDTPITIIQMLWVNIIMDTLGGLAFAGEPALDYYMHEPPKRRDEPILSREVLHQIFILGAYTLVLCVIFLTSRSIREIYRVSESPDRFYTAFYALFIFAGIFNCFLARCERLWVLSNIGKNKPFVFIMLLISLIQVCMIYFGGEVFRCVPLYLPELSFVILIAATVIPFDMARRLLYKLK